jgi:hypothetical protein
VTRTYQTGTAVNFSAITLTSQIGTRTTATKKCTGAEEFAVGGGGNITGNGVALSQSESTEPHSWTVTASQTNISTAGGTSGSITPFVVCEK